MLAHIPLQSSDILTANPHLQQVPENIMSNMTSPRKGPKEATTKQAPPREQWCTPPSTPTSTSSSAHELLQDLQNVHSTLLTLPSLAPGPETNVLFTHLVQQCTKPYNELFTSTFLSLPGVEKLSLALRPLCATAEGELERHWAGRIIDSLARTCSTPTQARNALSAFPYHQNYIDLSRLECSLLEAFLPHPAPLNIAFIGSGPLPLTSFCMLDRYPSAKAHNIDRDVTALSISNSLSKGLGYGERMTFECADAGTDYRGSTAWEDFDVVFLAALVGMDTETKIEILRSLGQKLRPGTLLVARSARGLRSVVYPVLEISEELQSTGFEMLAELHPWTEVVNSVIVMRVREC